MEPTNPIVLSDGQEVHIDLNKITVVEFRSMVKPGQSDEDEYEMMSRVSGLDVTKLGYADYKIVIAAFFEAAKAPVDPF